MKKIIVPLTLILVLAGCGNQNQSSAASPQSTASSAASVSTAPSSFSQPPTASAAAEKAMQDSDYPNLIEGSLTKDEMTNVAQVLIQNGIVEDGRPDDYLLYFYNAFDTIKIDIVQENIPGSEIRLDHISAAEANRYLSSFTDFRFTPETAAAEDDGTAYAIYLKDGYVYWKEGGIGGTRDYEDTAEIVEAAYDDLQMNLRVSLQKRYYADSHVEDSYYDFELTKLEDGKYQVANIYKES